MPEISFTNCFEGQSGMNKSAVQTVRKSYNSYQSGVYKYIFVPKLAKSSSFFERIIQIYRKSVKNDAPQNIRTKLSKNK